MDETVVIEKVLEEMKSEKEQLIFNKNRGEGSSHRKSTLGRVTQLFNLSGHEARADSRYRRLSKFDQIDGDYYESYALWFDMITVAYYALMKKFKVELKLTSEDISGYY